MEFKTIDPRTIKANPNNPRRTAPIRESDASLLASIKTLGILQPPVVAPDEDGFKVIAGARRIKMAIKLKMDTILVLVRDPDEDNGQMAAVAENVVREPMSMVDQWRALEALSGAGWTDPAISAALALNKKTLRQLRLFGRIHPAMLDQMARGDMPDENDLRTIAIAPPEEQAAIWKIHKPKTKDEEADWDEISGALAKRRMYAKVAKFGDEVAKAHGIVWEEDLFEQADEDPRYTTQVDAFLGAQTEWVYNQLNENTILLANIGRYGEAELPAGARRNYGVPEDGDKIGYYIHEYTGEVRGVRFKIAKTGAPEQTSGGPDRLGNTQGQQQKTRAPITQKGQNLIGEYRTNALHKALTKNEFDDHTLIALLILALSANNVSIQSNSDVRIKDLAIKLTQGGRIKKDIDLLRATGRQVLTSLLSCAVNYSNSGIAARIAGDAIGADQHLDNMATEEFLSCLSKAEIEKTATELGIKPRGRAKDTRAAILAQVSTSGLVLPAAHFALTEEELNKAQSYYGWKRDGETEDENTQNENSSNSFDENETEGFVSDEDEPDFPSDENEPTSGKIPPGDPNSDEESGQDDPLFGEDDEDGEDCGQEDSHNNGAIPENFDDQIKNQLRPN